MPIQQKLTSPVSSNPRSRCQTDKKISFTCWWTWKAHMLHYCSSQRVSWNQYATNPSPFSQFQLPAQSTHTWVLLYWWNYPSNFRCSLEKRPRWRVHRPVGIGIWCCRPCPEKRIPGCRRHPVGWWFGNTGTCAFCCIRTAIKKRFGLLIEWQSGFRW